MKQAITGYPGDEFDERVAELECGHHRQVRHDPPLANRPWVETGASRESMPGHLLDCRKCDRDEPVDW